VNEPPRTPSADPRATEAAPSEAYTRYVLGVVLLVMIFNNVDRTILSILVEPIKAEFGVSDTAMGAAMGLAFTLVYSVVSLPVSRWADFGVRRSIIALGLFVWSGFTAATAAVQGIGQLFAMRMGVGIGEAAGTPPSLSLLSDYLPPQRRARGLSVVSIGAVSGMGLGMVAGGWINELYGWRAAFVAVGLPGILLVGIVSDSFQASFGENALRYSLLIPTAAPLLSALVCVFGAGAVGPDLEHAARDEA
jgi:MFS family permease